MIILGAKESPTEAEIASYREAHPHTHVIVLYRKDCGEEGKKKEYFNFVRGH